MGGCEIQGFRASKINKSTKEWKLFHIILNCADALCRKETVTFTDRWWVLRNGLRHCLSWAEGQNVRAESCESAFQPVMSAGF